MYNLGVFLGVQQAITKKVAVVARRVFALICLMYQLHPFLNLEAIQMVIHGFVTSQFGLFQWALDGFLNTIKWNVYVDQLMIAF